MTASCWKRRWTPSHQCAASRPLRAAVRSSCMPTRATTTLLSDRLSPTRHRAAYHLQGHRVARAAGTHRWVVERTLAWLNRYRRLTVRYEQRADIHLAFLPWAACSPAGKRSTADSLDGCSKDVGGTQDYGRHCIVPSLSNSTLMMWADFENTNCRLCSCKSSSTTWSSGNPFGWKVCFMSIGSRE